MHKFKKIREEWRSPFLESIDDAETLRRGVQLAARSAVEPLQIFPGARDASGKSDRFVAHLDQPLQKRFGAIELTEPDLRLAGQFSEVLGREEIAYLDVPERFGREFRILQLVQQIP